MNQLKYHPTHRFIRHIDKPYAGFVGVDIHGDHDPEGPNVPGWIRAGALVHLFCDARIDHLFACSKRGSSERAVDTLRPFAEFHDLAVNTNFAPDQTGSVARAIKQFPGNTLTAWEHSRIREILAHFITDDEMRRVPEVWPDDRFDMIYCLRWDGEGYQFSQEPQMLVSGDSDVVFRVTA